MDDYKEMMSNAFQMKLAELLEVGVPLEEAEKQAMDFMQKAFEGLGGGFANGGRIGFDDGGYAETVKDLIKSRDELPAESVTVAQDNPYYEALVASYAPDLAVAGNTPITQTNLVPEAAKQNDAQKLAMEMQLRQSG